MVENDLLQKEKLVEVLGGMTALAKDLGMDAVAKEIEQEWVPKLLNERFNIVVLGEFNHGKTTLINALLETEILPTGPTPTTGLVYQIRYSDTEFIKVVYPDRTVEIDKAELNSYSIGAEQPVAEIDSIEVGLPNEFLKEQLVFVDTPGTNDINAEMAEVTYHYIPRADLIVFVLDCGQPLKVTEQRFLANKLFSYHRNRILFILNKADLVTLEELRETEDFVLRNLKKIFGEITLFSTSVTKEARNQDLAELKKTIRQMIDTDRASIILDNVSKVGLSLAADIKHHLALKKRSYSLEVSELQQKLEVFKQKMTDGQKALSEYHQVIDIKLEEIKKGVSLDVERFQTDFKQAIEIEVDKADAADVKQFFQSYIQDKTKEWLELQGDKLGFVLENLAQEIIEVASKNIASTLDDIAEELDFRQVDVRLQVDTFMYDVGIVALGALGSMMLFMNMVTGGVLALVAAPVLALLVKSRISKDIKEIAKEKGKESVDVLAKALLDKFNAVIDDFGAKLKEFLKGAGHKIHQNVLTVITQVIQEKQSAEFKVADKIEALDQQIETVNALEKTVREMRG